MLTIILNRMKLNIFNLSATNLLITTLVVSYTNLTGENYNSYLL